MLYEHNWHQKKDTKRSEEISDDFSIKKMEQSNDRLEKALSCSDGLIENKILSISVSELVERFFVSKTMKSDEITNFGPRSDEATIYGALVHSFLQLLPMYVEKNTNSKKVATFSGGSYGRTNEILEYGKSFGDYAVYLGANFNVDRGWRDKSESYLETFYSDFRYRGEDTELFLNIGQAFTDLRGKNALRPNPAS